MNLQNIEQKISESSNAAVKMQDFVRKYNASHESYTKFGKRNFKKFLIIGTSLSYAVAGAGVFSNSLNSVFGGIIFTVIFGSCLSLATFCANELALRATDIVTQMFRHRRERRKVEDQIKEVEKNLDSIKEIIYQKCFVGEEVIDTGRVALLLGGLAYDIRVHENCLKPIKSSITDKVKYTQEMLNNLKTSGKDANIPLLLVGVQRSRVSAGTVSEFIRSPEISLIYMLHAVGTKFVAPLTSEFTGKHFSDVVDYIKNPPYVYLSEDRLKEDKLMLLTGYFETLASGRLLEKDEMRRILTCMQQFSKSEYSIFLQKFKRASRQPKTITNIAQELEFEGVDLSKMLQRNSIVGDIEKNATIENTKNSTLNVKLLEPLKSVKKYLEIIQLHERVLSAEERVVFTRMKSDINLLQSSWRAAELTGNTQDILDCLEPIKNKIQLMAEGVTEQVSKEINVIKRQYMAHS